MGRSWRRFKNRHLGDIPQRVSEKIPKTPPAEPGDEEGSRRVSRENKIKFIVLIAIILAMIGITIALIPFINQLLGADSRDALAADVRNAGAGGIFIILGLQVLQVVIAFIPGEVVQIVSGMIYGTWGGWLICEIGCGLASACVYWLVGKLGMPFVEQMVSPSQAKRFKFLQDSERVDIVVFILFLIPAMPKDVLTYLVPLTKMPLKRFLVLSLAARTPGILATTYGGSALLAGHYLQTALVFIIFGGLGILGIVYRDKILGFFHHDKEEVPVEADSIEDDIKADAARRASVSYTHHDAPDFADAVVTEEDEAHARRKPKGFSPRSGSSRGGRRYGRRRKQDRYDIDERARNDSWAESPEVISDGDAERGAAAAPEPSYEVPDAEVEEPSSDKTGAGHAGPDGDEPDELHFYEE